MRTPEVESMQYYLINKNAEQVGPFTIDEVRAMWKGGEVDFDTLHWSEGMDEWKPLRLIAKSIHAKEPTLHTLSLVVPERPAAILDWTHKSPEKKKSWVNWRFWGSFAGLLFVLSLMAYFIFPDALNTAISVAYDEYIVFFPPKADAHPRPVVVAPPPTAPAPPKVTVKVEAPEVLPDPPQQYTKDEIKEAVQSNLVNGGVTPSGTVYEWKRLEYTDDTNVRYELFAHVAGDSVKFCAGMVALNRKKHQIVIISQLSG